MISFFGRAMRMYNAKRIRGLCHENRFDKALKISRASLKDNPNSVAFNILNGDVLLFRHDFSGALASYLNAMELLDKNKKLSKRDRIFLSGYLNFRRLAIDHKTGKQEFRHWNNISKQINQLPASEHLKTLFTLPEG